MMILGTHDPRTGHVSEDTWSSLRAGVEVMRSRLSSQGDEEVGMDVVFGGPSSSKACQNISQEACNKVSFGKHAYVSKKAIALTDSRLEHGLAEAYAPCLAGLHAKYSYDYIISADTSHSRNILPRLGAMIRVEPIHGIVQVCDGGNTYVRSMYAGNILCTVQVPSDSLQILTCRSGNFPQKEPIDMSFPVKDESPWFLETIHDMSTDLLHGAPVHLPTTFVSRSTRDATGSLSLSHATIVVAGGRAFKTKEEFEKLETLAEKIGAAVGATRALVDAGICPNEMQIGQTGKIIAPDVYIAFGISGAIQHIAGIKDSRCIIAINSDEEAPIFDAADYGMVGNVHEFLDRLLEIYNK